MADHLKIPYSMVPAVEVAKRRENVLSSISRRLPRLERSPVDDTRSLYVACYGPSLEDTWQELKGKSPIISMSGATKWLYERGITADFHIEADPRPSQLIVSLPPVPGVTYLLASCVCEQYFDRVLAAGNRVVLWHTVNTNWDEEARWVAANDQAQGEQLVISAGSTVGLSALQLGGILGFRRFIIHGMDASFKDGKRHAGFHGGKGQTANTNWDAGGKRYTTSQIMANSAAETVNTARNFPIITIWHGDGLTQALIREANLINAACADETEKVQRLMGLWPRVVHTPPLPTKGKVTFWDALLPFLQPDDLPELVHHIHQCESRRPRATYNTGTIPFESAVYLRAISRFYEPDVIAEVGTFIGTSTQALKAKRVIYTCDKSNDCLPSRLSHAGPQHDIVTHPFQSSTQMLKEIQEPVDLFFFDGRIQDEDVPEIRRVMHDGSVFVFDDYQGQEKGAINVQKLLPYLGRRTLITPAKGVSTLALIVPYMQQAREAV